MEQAGKEVIERNVEGYGGGDVVGFTTIDDITGLPQDQSAGEQGEHP